MRAFHRLFAILVCGSVAAACEAPPDTAGVQPGPATRDSAGVRIVEHGPVHDRPTSVTVAGEALWRVGWDASGPLLEDVRAGVLLPDGGALLGDHGATTLHRVEADGSVADSRGSAGEGPGEFRSIFSIVTEGDTVAVHDLFQARLSVFEGSRFLHSIRTDRVDGHVHLANSLHRGRVVLLLFSPGPVEEEGSEWVRVPVLSTDLQPGPAPDGHAYDTVVVVDHLRRRDHLDRAPQRRTTHVDSRDGRLAWGRNDRPQLQLRQDGALTLIRWQQDTVAMTDSVWAVYADTYVERRAPETDEERAGYREGTRVLRTRAIDMVPLFSEVHLDGAGRVWVGDWAWVDHPPTAFTVFGADGTFVARVGVPEDFRILDIGRDRILAVERNELDVQAVAAYAMDLQGG